MRKSFTLIELQVACMVLLILWLMIAGIEYFLVQNTMPFIVKEDPDPKLALVFDHMERNISQGISWSKDVSGNDTNIYISVPGKPQIRYEFNMTDKKIRFYTDAENQEQSEVLADNISSYYVSDVDPNSRRVYIRLQGPESAISQLTHKTAGISLSRIFKMRALW